eukprot:g27338.t1
MEGAPPVALNQLEVLCSYADPNYGFLWFWCRGNSLSTPREARRILRVLRVTGADSDTAQYLWQEAWRVQVEEDLEDDEAFDSEDDRPSSYDATRIPVPCHQMVEADFAVGSLRLSSCFVHSVTSLNTSERRRLIFGSDILSS